MWSAAIKVKKMGLYAPVVAYGSFITIFLYLSFLKSNFIPRRPLTVTKRNFVAFKKFFFLQINNLNLKSKLYQN